ncbi:tyrosine-type recombinase/integrase [Methanolobus sp. WCC4]|uniref:tyrosine-type recombinase/integrase n=1 Tax=Methanolobus sp. WCC4 TaxID=3125784 RepID=UPI0030F78BE0
MDIFIQVMKCQYSKEQKTVLEEFWLDCECRDFHQRTRETYRSNVRYFLNFTKVDINSIFENFYIETNFDELKKFLLHLRRRKLSQSTINGYFAALSTFFGFLHEYDKTNKNIIPDFRKRYVRMKKKFNHQSERQIIDVPTMVRLIDEPLRTKAGQVIKDYCRTVPERDRAIMTLLAKTGLRREELRLLEINDIDIENGIIYINPEFSKRTNCMGFFDQEAKMILKEYLRWRSSIVRSDNRKLFVTHTGAKLRKDDIYYIVTYYAKRIGIHDPHGPTMKKYTPICFRHWFTTWLRRNGMSREFRKWLRGDAPEGADDWYDHVFAENVKPAYLKLIPKFDEFRTKACETPVQCCI